MHPINYYYIQRKKKRERKTIQVSEEVTMMCSCRQGGKKVNDRTENKK